MEDDLTQRTEALIFHDLYSFSKCAVYYILEFISECTPHFCLFLLNFCLKTHKRFKVFYFIKILRCNSTVSLLWSENLKLLAWWLLIFNLQLEHYILKLVEEILQTVRLSNQFGTLQNIHIHIQTLIQVSTWIG